MAKIAMIGGPASGKSVVAGLMYEAASLARSDQIREYNYYPSSDDEDLEAGESTRSHRNFDFEMGTDEQTLKYLGDELSGRLRKGEFPPPTPTTTLTRLQFYFHIPRRIWGRRIGVSKTQDIGLYEVAGESVKKILESVSMAKNKYEISQALYTENVLRTLLQSEVFVILVNSEICKPISYEDTRRAQQEVEKQTKSDFETSIFLTAIRNYKYLMKGKIKALGILFTMHDEVWATVPLNNREECEKALRTSMRTTWTQLNYLRQLSTGGIGNIKYFKSGLETRYDEVEQKEKPAIPLRFYIREYLDLIYWLINI